MMPDDLRPRRLSSASIGRNPSLFAYQRSGTDLRTTYTVEDSYGHIAKATSNEWNVAEALKQLHIDFSFQVPIKGGRRQKFGLVLDFMLHTVPYQTPLWVHGDYWHQGSRRAVDIKQMQEVEEAFGGRILPAIEIWGHESNSVEDAKNALLAKGLG